MKTLIIPDVHTHWARAEAIIAGAPPHDQVVFLGDYFDEFNDTADSHTATCEWFKRSAAEPGRVHLLGNHDVSYLGSAYRCSGWFEEKQRLFDELSMREALLQTCRLSVYVDGWTLTHAGLGRRYAEAAIDWPESRIWNSILANKPSPYTSVSAESGGLDRYDGPLWLRPRSVWFGSDDYVPVPQVFGHTPDRTPRLCSQRAIVALGPNTDGLAPGVKTRTIVSSADAKQPPAVCLDTGLRHYGVLTDGVLEIFLAPPLDTDV